MDERSQGWFRLLVRALERDVHRLLGDALEPLGVTPAQAEVLAVLATAAERQPVALQALGERLVCEVGSPSRLVEGLVRAGLVERKPVPGDGRKVGLSLTGAGRRCAAAVAEAEAAFEAGLSAQLGGSLQDVNGLLWRLVGQLPAGRALRLRRGGRVPARVG